MRADRELLQSYCLLLFDHGTADYVAAGGVCTHILELPSAIAVRPPSNVRYGELKLMPWWDPLRGDPRFEKIVASLAPKETGNR